MTVSVFIFPGGVLMITVNGEKINADGKTVAEFIASTDYNPARIAVELNGEIVPKAKYADVVLADGDTLEVVGFVGGG